MIWVQLIVVTAIAIGFYKLIEKPLLKFIHKSSLWDTVSSMKKKKIAVEPKSVIEKVEPVVS